MTARCPVHGVAASTGYTRRACRCPTCTEWNRERSNRVRRARGAQVTLSKRPGVVMCPVTGKSPPTAYRDGCRCQTCLRYNRIKSQKHRAKVGMTDRMIKTRERDLLEEFLRAFKLDIAYAVDMANAAREAFEFENSDSANAA